MSLFAATTRASSGRSSTRGTTSAARMPRITMTTMHLDQREAADARRTLRVRGRLHRGDYNPARPVRRGAPRASAPRPRPCPDPLRLVARTAALLLVAAARVAAGVQRGGSRSRCRCRLRRTRSTCARREPRSVARELTAAGVAAGGAAARRAGPLARRRSRDQGGQLRDRARASRCRSSSTS